MLKKQFNNLTIQQSVLGFTLVELLISIGIMAVVFGVIISSTSQIQKQGRDTQRQADLRTIQGALQQYYADQGFYPDDNLTPPALNTTPLTLGTTTSLTSDIGSVVPLPSPVKNYLSKIPTDPNTTPAYVYKSYVSSSNLTSNCDNVSTSTTKCNYYELCAKLEGSVVNTYCGTVTHNLKITPQ